MISEKAEEVSQVPGQNLHLPPNTHSKKVLAEANKDSFGRKVREQLNRSLKNKKHLFLQI